MTVGLSATVAASYLNAKLRATNWTAPTAVYMKLHIGDPGAAGTANPSVGSTTRVVVTHAAPSAGSTAMSGTAPSWTHGSANGTGTETLTHVSYWDSATAGNFLESASIGIPKSWSGTDIFALTQDTHTVSPVAA